MEERDGMLVGTFRCITGGKERDNSRIRQDLSGLLSFPALLPSLCVHTVQSRRYVCTKNKTQKKIMEKEKEERHPPPLRIPDGSS